MKTPAPEVSRSGDVSVAIRRAVIEAAISIHGGQTGGERKRRKGMSLLRSFSVVASLRFVCFLSTSKFLAKTKKTREKHDD